MEDLIIMFNPNGGTVHECITFDLLVAQAKIDKQNVKIVSLLDGRLISYIQWL